MRALSSLLKRHRTVLLLATLWGSVPWLLACICVPLAAKTAIGNLPPPYTLFYWLLRIFGPLCFYTDELFSWEMTLMSSHMHWPSHYINWTLFTVVNVAFLVVIFGLIKLLIDRVGLWILGRNDSNR